MMAAVSDLEVWECIVDAIEHRFLRTEFEPGEFRVEHNDTMRTVTVIRTDSRKAFQIMDITGTHFTGGADDNDPIHVVFPRKR